MKLIDRFARLRPGWAVLALLVAACAPTLPPGKSGVISTSLPSAVSKSSASHEKASRMLGLEAEALFAAGKPVEATEALVRRNKYLTTSDARAENRQRIWSGLMTHPLTDADLKGSSAAGSMTQGWIALARLAQNNASIQQYARWQKRYPHHPGNRRLLGLMMAGPRTAPLLNSQSIQVPVVGSGQAALLLPLRGPLSAAGQMVQEGFESEQHAMDVNRPMPQVYDDGSASGRTLRAFQSAVGSGASIVIGPLEKQAVTELAQQGASRIPVLALNYLPPDTPTPANFFQFGLSPADEARQAATSAYGDGLTRAIALVPDNLRGSQILAAFQEQLATLGGKVVASAQYRPETQDFSSIVRSLLDINASIARDREVAQVIGLNPVFVPRRRQDISFIFISGNSTEDRLMASMFRFWHAVSLPIYATAGVNTKIGDNDLAGVRFCDAPWILEPGPQWDAVRDRIVQASQGLGLGYQRLFALGMDAARLTARLRQGALRPGTLVPGYTGELSISENGVVRRRLACAQVVAGGPPRIIDPVILPAPGASTAGIPDVQLPGQVPTPQSVNSKSPSTANAIPAPTGSVAAPATGVSVTAP